MKKILCILLVLVMCLGVMAGCGEPTTEYNLTAAKTLIKETYEKFNVAPTSDFDLPAKTVVDGTTYEVTWTVDNANITVKESSKKNYVTIDLPEFNTTETTFKLTATIKAPDGTTITLDLDRTLGVYDNRGIAAEFEEGKAYKMFLEQKTLGQTLFALNTDQQQGKYINTTNDPKLGADFYIEIVEGGYKFYTMVGETKTYVYAKLVEASDGHFSKYVGFSTENATVFEYNTDLKTFFANFGENGKYGFGTYSDYNTMCISEESHFQAAAIGVSQYVVQFMDKTVAESLTPDEEKPFEVKLLDGAVAPTAGNKYVIGFHHGGKDNAAYYLTGAMDGHYAATVTDITKGANFYVEEVTGGFNLYGIIAGEKLYVNFVKSGSYTNIKYEATATTVFTYDETLKTFKTTMTDGDYILGTKATATFTTLGPVKADAKNYYVQFVPSTNADQTKPEGGDQPGTDTPGTDTPGAEAGIELTVNSLGIPDQQYIAGTATVGGTAFEFIQIGNYGNGIQVRDKDGKTSTLWNTTAFGSGIVKIVMVFNGAKDTYDNPDAEIFTFGNAMGEATYTAKLSTTAGVKTYTITPDVDTYTFFKFEHDLGYTMYWDSITIVLKDGSTITPDQPGTDTPGTDTPGTDTPGTDTPGTDTPATTYTPATELKDGDVVIIVADAYKMALSANKTGYYNVGVDYSAGFDGITDAELFVVTVNADGTYTFTSKTGKVIAMAESNASLNDTGTNTSWELTAKDGADGVFYVKNTGRGNYLEWYTKYSNWSTYATTTFDGQFEISFLVETTTEGGTTTPDQGGTDVPGTDTPGTDTPGTDTPGTDTPAAGTVTVVIADYADANSWTNGTRYAEIVMNDYITVTAAGTAVGEYSLNTGKYYTSGENWRIYQTEAATVTITAAEGKTIASVKITYNVKNSGTLTLNGEAVASATVVTVDADTITFGVGNTGTATNGQAQITAIEVVYA